MNILHVESITAYYGLAQLRVKRIGYLAETGDHIDYHPQLIRGLHVSSDDYADHVINAVAQRQNCYSP